MEVAPVRHFEQNRTGKLRVGFAEATVKGTTLFNSPITEAGMDRLLRSLPFGHGRLAAPNSGPEGTVVFALLNQKDLVALKQPCCFDPLQANRAKAFSFVQAYLFHDVIHA
jgi:hypothetical protein